MSGAQHGSLGAGASAPSSSRNRKRRSQASRAQRSAAQAHAGPGSGPQQHNIQQGFAGGPRGGFVPNQMPPPGMHPPHGPPLTGMGLGSVPSEDDLANYILDDLDMLTDRDLAMTRYKRNHELLNLIFDARRIGSLEPSPSPYADRDQTALKEQHTLLEKEIETIREAHTLKYRRWRDEVNEQDAKLHAPPKRLRLQRAEQERHQDGGAGEGQQGSDEATGVGAPEWAANPSRGSIIGVGFVRAKTPEEVRKLLPRPPEPEPVAAPPAPAVPVSQATQSSTPGGSGAPTMLAPTEKAAESSSAAPQNGTAAPLPAHAQDAVPTHSTISESASQNIGMDVDEGLAGGEGDDDEDGDDDDDEDEEDDEDDVDEGDEDDEDDEAEAGGDDEDGDEDGDEDDAEDGDDDGDQNDDDDEKHNVEQQDVPAQATDLAIATTPEVPSIEVPGENDTSMLIDTQKDEAGSGIETISAQVETQE